MSVLKTMLVYESQPFLRYGRKTESNPQTGIESLFFHGVVICTTLPCFGYNLEVGSDSKKPCFPQWEPESGAVLSLSSGLEPCVSGV